MFTMVYVQNRYNNIFHIHFESLPDNFLFSKPPQFKPPLKYWKHMKNFNSDTTNCGVEDEFLASTPRFVESEKNFFECPQYFNRA